MINAFSEFRLAAIQLAVSSNKADNVKKAVDLISKAAENGAKIISLPVRMVQPGKSFIQFSFVTLPIMCK